MLDEEQLAVSIEIQKRSYGLLRWISEALDSGQIEAPAAARHSNDPSAALDWISTYSHAIPSEIGPEPNRLDEFANFFWTYIVTSFDVATDPGTRGEGQIGCSCDLCNYIVKAPHLRPKKLRSRDKKRAMSLMAGRVTTLGQEHGITLSSKASQSVINDAQHRRNAAFSAYGEWLIKRMNGETDGPSVLALWREIAWNRSGSPIHGFTLQLEDFQNAETELLKAITSL